MVIYYFLLLYFWILSALEIGNAKIPRGIKALSLVILITIMGFRYAIGADFFNYVHIFNHTDWFVEPIEMGCLFLMDVLQSIGLNAQSFFLVSSLITLIPISYVIDKEIPKYFHVALCFYIISFLYFEAMNTVRQGMAMALCFLALFLYHNHKRFLSYLIIAVSFFFHQSSFVIVTIYILACFIKTNRWLYLLFILLSFVFGKYLLDMIGDYAYLFMHSEYAMEKRGVSSGAFQIFLNLTAIILVLFYNKYFQNSTEISRSCKLYVMSIVIYNIFINFYVVLRLYYYFFMSIIILIPFLLSYQKKLARVFIFNTFFLFFSIYSLVSLNNSNYNNFKFNFDLQTVVNSNKE